MTNVYAAKLGFITRTTNYEAQKIGGLPMETYVMATTEFLL